MSERLLTIAEVGAAVGRSSITIVRYIRGGRLSAVRVGVGPRAPLFVPEGAVQALARSMRRPAGKPPEATVGRRP